MIKSTRQIKVFDIEKLDTYSEKRNCFSEMEAFVESGRGTKGQLCALYGLRRTGKTVLLSQMAQEKHKQGYKCLYLECSDEEANFIQDQRNSIKHIPEITELYDILDKAIEENYEFIFIDEISFIRDFVGQGNLLSNFYANQGLNIFVTGTDSLSFVLAAQDDLYDRLKKIRTTYISFEEYNRLLGKSLEEYIQYGGTLTEESPYKNGSSTLEYTNTAIVKNIIRSIKQSEHLNGQAITLLYPEKDIISVIHRCVNQMNQRFLISAINRNYGIYESHPLNLALHNSKSFPYYEMEKNIQQQAIDVIYQALSDLDFAIAVPTYTRINGDIPIYGKELQIISQAGMIYCHSTELLKALVDEENWNQLEKCGIDNKDTFIKRMDRQVKGDILENLIIFDTYQAFKEKYYVTKIQRKSDNKEVDVSVIDKESKETYLFEVKYSNHIEKDHIKNLSSQSFIEYISENFGEVKARFVIYTGAPAEITDSLGDITYISAEEYLKNITHCSDILELLGSLKGIGKYSKDVPAQVSTISVNNRNMSDIISDITKLLIANTENPVPILLDTIKGCNEAIKKIDNKNKANHIENK